MIDFSKLEGKALEISQVLTKINKFVITNAPKLGTDVMTLAATVGSMYLSGKVTPDGVVTALTEFEQLQSDFGTAIVTAQNTPE